MRRVAVAVSVLVTSLLIGCGDKSEVERRQQRYDACNQALTEGEDSASSAAIPQLFRVLVWNVQKGENPHLFTTLQTLSANKDLVLLQEATHDPRIIKGLEENHSVYFAPGYQTSTMKTGVLTASSVPALGSCHQSTIEPILRTPKATALSLFSIEGRQQKLLVINIHGVNFSVGASALKEQLQKAVERAEQHDGPIIFAGDFNTWNGERQRLVDGFMQRLSLVPLEYTDDRRKRVFSYHLDHLYSRGLELVTSGTVLSGVSDHNPIMAVFRVK